MLSKILSRSQRVATFYISPPPPPTTPRQVTNLYKKIGARAALDGPHAYPRLPLHLTRLRARSENTPLPSGRPSMA